jgi:AcrR family transcriptional regulator
MAPALSTKDALLQATGELLAELGYAEMTTAAVARKAKVAEGTIYRHFPSKEALAEAVFDRAWDLLVGHMETHLPPRETPEARLRAFLRVSMDAFLAHPLEAAICTQEHMYWVALRGVCELPPGPERFIGLLEEAIRLAQKAGVARPELDARLVAHMLFHGVGHVKQRFLLPGPDGTPPPYTPDAFITALDAFIERALFTEPR